MRKLYKKIEQNNGSISFYSSNRWRKLFYAIPKWEKDGDLHQYFIDGGRRIYLDDFMIIEKHAPEYMQEFDGYLSDSFFSGLCIKFPKEDDYDHEDMVKVYLFIS